MSHCLRSLSSVETLEARLAESDGECSAPVDQEELAYMSRPGKRKRNDYENHTKDTYTTPIPVCSPPEYTLPVHSTEQMYFSEPSPSVYLPEQQFVQEQENPLLESILQQHFAPKLTYSPEPILQSDHSLSPEYSPKQTFEPVELHFPNHSAAPEHCLSVPKVSPLSDSSDHQSMGHDVVNYSSHNFAGPQFPTPEYQISECSEFIVPEQRYSNGYSEYQPSLQCMCPPVDPYMSLVPEMHDGAANNQQLAFVAPIQPNVVGSLDPSILPDINEAERHPRVAFFSTEDLNLACL